MMEDAMYSGCQLRLECVRMAEKKSDKAQAGLIVFT